MNKIHHCAVGRSAQYLLRQSPFKAIIISAFSLLCNMLSNKIHLFYKQCCARNSVYQNKVLQLIDRFREKYIVFVK